MDRIAVELGFDRQVVWGTQFPHVVYRHRSSSTARRLHVYIEGDGQAWSTRHEISPDPTSHYGLMLRLMALDAQPSLYLGRPCYSGFAQTPPCSPRYWTDERYAQPVIDSMAAALAQLVPGSHSVKLVLIGHSGGGTLAVLLAPRLANVDAVVTVAGNLDSEAWTRHHGYSALAGSLNPAELPALNPQIRQWHLQGEHDNEVPPQLSAQFAAHQPHARFWRYPEFDHHCCWEAAWPQILQQLEQDLDPSNLSHDPLRKDSAD